MTHTTSREDEYAERLSALIDDANEAHAIGELVAALAWTLARIAGHYGKPWVAGDIVRRIGAGLCHIEEQKAAHAEAEEARSAGTAFH